MKPRFHRLFSILLVICMIFSMLPTAAVQAAAPGTLYFKPGDNWLADNPRFAAYFYGTNGEKWESFTALDNGYYRCDAPTSGYESLIVCRMNPGSGDNNWDNKWNQSADLTIPTDGKNCVTLSGNDWNGESGAWGVYECITSGHSYSEVITTPAGCTSGGVKTLTCVRSGCGDSYTADIPATGHNYVSGTCQNCGDTLSFYLFGYINGSNYACEEDGSNLGTYKFENGTLTATFATDSYVGVKTGDNTTWYMTDGYPGDYVTSATLYNTAKGIEAEKLFVPGGVAVTFTLGVGSDDTLTLSYTVNAAGCSHSTHGTDGVCKICGTSVGHSWDNGTCTGCDLICSHSYNSSVTTEANCTQDGVRTYTCSVCGHSYTEGISATGHDYVAGSCQNCGDKLDFYLFGFINGGNYACEDDGSNLGTYKFENGKLTVTFTSDSYIGVKTSDNAHWYMFQNYVNATSATLYNTTSGAVEKMYVPGNVSITFTLTAGSGDTLNLSYALDTSTCSHPSHGTDGKCTVCGTSVDHSYNSSVTTEANCTQDGVRTYTCSVCGHTYTEGISASGHNYVAGSCQNCGDTLDFYLFGFINGGNYACEDDGSNLGTYKFENGKLTVTFTSDSYIGVKTSDNAHWYMCQSYVNATSATLYNTSSGAVEKMYVPAGRPITFTLSAGEGDTLVLSYTAGDCDHKYQSVVTDPTCTAGGYTTYTCTYCGDTYTADETAATGHHYNNGVCTGCGATFDGIRFHLLNTLGWEGVVAYAWTDNALSGYEWPGKIIDRDEKGYFTFTLDYVPKAGESLNLLFHNFNGGQTADITISYETLSAHPELWLRPDTATNSDGKYPCTVATAQSDLVVSPEINGTSVTFRYAGTAESVYLVGSFNDWDTSATAMTEKDGVWSVTMELAAGAYEYKFIVDENWVCDPGNGVLGGYDGNNVVVVPGEKAPEGKIKVVLHFYRESGDYDGWDVWFWDNDASGSCDFTADANGKGMLATYVLSSTNNNNVGYVVRKSDWSDKEFYDRTISLGYVKSGTVHYFLKSGSASGSIIYGPDVVCEGNIQYATLDYEAGTIWVKTSLPVAGDATGAFSIVKEDGSATGITVTSATLSGNGYTLSLSQKLNLNQATAYRVKFNGGLSTIGYNAHNLFYSSTFNSDYNYTGDDLGATWSKNSTTFKVWAPTAKKVQVLRYRGGNYGTDDWIETVDMTLGDKGVWSATVSGDLNGTYYNYLVHFDGYTTEATDPYAKATGANGDRGMVIDLDSTDPLDWDNDISPNKGMAYTDAVIYELHVREFTIDESSGVKEAWRGKYLGLTQTGTNYDGYSTVLSHLKELGVTHVQLMPVYDYSSVDEYHLSDWQQYAWGYDPKNFNVPEGSYSTDPFNGEVRVNEFKQMVQSFHENGMNVVMDVVFNHFFDGGNFCYNKIVPNYFSRFYGEGNWSNGSGVGNDMATERVMARNFIVDTILYWVEEYHIDGFRFDLAGLIDTQTINEIVSTVHAKYPYVIFYGEGWAPGDTAVEYGYDLTTQGNAWEVSGFSFFNDTIRNAIAGDNGSSWGFASGSWDYADTIASCFRASNGWSSTPTQTINYVSCHDNYSLIDKIILSKGGTDWFDMVKMNNLAAAVNIMAQGTPFIYSGEELLREKKDGDGNRHDNAYGTDDYVNKIRWSDLKDKQYAQMTDDYYCGLINFRKNHAALRNSNGADAWNAVSYYKISDQVILFYIDGFYNYETSDGICIIYNASTSSQTVNLGNYIPGGYWQACVHGTQAGITPLWGVNVGSGYGEIGVDAISTTILVLGDLVHEESVYNSQASNCGHSWHNISGMCTNCGKSVSHNYVNGTCTGCGLSESAPTTYTVYFDNSQYNWQYVNVYSWASTAGRTVEFTGQWPGTAMTLIDEANGIYACDVPIGVTELIFSGHDGQTGNLTAPGYTSTTTLYRTDGTWNSYTPPCTHSYSDSVTKAVTCTSDGELTHTCTLCGYSYTETIEAQGHKHVKTVVEATCTTGGYTKYTCSGCGDTYTEDPVAAKRHSYVNGTCSTCGTVKAYYLFGYINGSNYAFEGDSGNMGIYKFVDGKLTVTFESDSYVAVKTIDNEDWYMTDGYQSDVTSVTLYNTNRGITAEKLMVPGGVEVTFTLTDNGDDTLTLSYTTPTTTLPTVAPKGAGLAFKDEIYYNVYFNIDNPDDVEIAEMGLLTWTSQVDGTVDNAEHILTGASWESAYYKIRSQAISAKNMAEELYMKVYLKLGDGTYVYSSLFHYNAKTYAEKMLASSSNESLKALCVAMLNYGAAAQQYFGYKTDDLMNANLTQEQKAMASGYSATMIPDLVKADATKWTSLTANSGFSGMSPSVNFGGAFGINYLFKPNKSVEGQMKLYVWTAEDYAAADELTLSNASQVLTMTDNGSGTYSAMVGGFAAKNAGDTVYVCGVYESGGVTYRTGVLSYSVCTYCKNLASSTSTMGALAQAAGVYTYYARAYLL